MQELLFEPGHPKIPVGLTIDTSAEGVEALANDEGLEFALEISCHPEMIQEELEGTPIRPGTSSLDKLLVEGEDMKDREKWALLTRELVQKQEIVHRLMRENDDKS